ncbi:MAG: Nif3-like dinuclear metal center hexameric protein [Duncaniella sp.]|nr:Nif3-like dinuclear metal center hexameric protein [Duncaniella sp.]
MSAKQSVTLADIVGCIEDFASPGIQEKWDNTGWQLCPLPVSTPCTGAMLCLDVTPEVVAEAKAEGCNLIISHHPLIFKGLRHITGASPVERAVISAISGGIAVYSSHTALDSASEGVSHRLGSMLGLTGMAVLAPQPGSQSTGLGIAGDYAEPLTIGDFIDRVKEVYGAPVVRRSAGPEGLTAISRVALCSGSGGEFVTDAIAAGADAYITSDTRYHDFVDHGKEILMIDTGHYESEICTKSIFSDIISEKFPNFAVRQSRAEQNPVRYV